MTFDQSLAVTGASDREADQAVEPFSADWWQRRTAEELREIIKRGFSGGQAFHSAVFEAERRARDATRRLREAEAIEAQNRRKRRRVMLLGTLVSVVTIAATAGVWLAR